MVQSSPCSPKMDIRAHKIFSLDTCIYFYGYILEVTNDVSHQENVQNIFSVFVFKRLSLISLSLKNVFDISSLALYLWYVFGASQIIIFTCFVD